VLACIFALAGVVGLSAGCGRSGSRGERHAAAKASDWDEPPGGRWNKSDWMEVTPQQERSLTPEQREEFTRLLSLGYVSGSNPIPANTGVVVYDGRGAQDGLNFYTSGHFPGAVLMDMTGKALHEWRYKFLDAWNAFPGSERPDRVKSGGFWRRARLMDNGDVIAIYDWLGIIKVDKDSKLLWAQFGGFHHDLDLLPDGGIVTLLRKARIVPRINPELPVLEDFIVILSPDGRERKRFSVLEAFENSECAHLLDGMADHGDILHTNTVQVLDDRLSGALPEIRPGDVLITVRQLGIIAAVDLDTERVVWGVDGHWKKPHEATALPNGHILIFDNRGYEGSSQVIEFEPATLKADWIYRGDPPKEFYSKECGSNQRLPNGNTLITESDRGKAFEVTPDGEIVWKYLNPMRAGDKLQFIATVFDLERIPTKSVTGWLGPSSD
jgi:hypothetical protein